MDIDEATVAIAGPPMDRPVEPYSESWWHSRSTEELRTLINRGFHQGPVFAAATAETERRARELLRDEEKAADLRARRDKKLRLMILEGVLAACLLAIVLESWLR